MDASKAGGASAIGFVEGTGRRNIDLANGVIVNPSSRHEMRRHDMRAGNIMAVVATVSTLFIAAAQAQSQRQQVPPPLAQPPNQNPCSPGARAGAPGANETTGSRTLSDRLAESKGVICPPADVDPAIVAPPIGGGRTPVVPPSGTPGGDPNIQPK
jgi:hypothetical protein